MTIDKVDNDKMQEVDLFQTMVVTRLDEIEKRLIENKDALRTLSDTLATHVRQNIDTFQKINEYIGEQMSYRLFRQSLEENNLGLELEKKKLELDFAQRKFEALEKEHLEDTNESSQLRYEYEKQKLELENLRKNLEILQNAKNSTQDKIKAVKAATNNPFQQKMKETVILTALGALTAAAVGGTVAFIVFFVRFYIQNSP